MIQHVQHTIFVCSRGTDNYSMYSVFCLHGLPVYGLLSAVITTDKPCWLSSSNWRGWSKLRGDRLIFLAQFSQPSLEQEKSLLSRLFHFLFFCFFFQRDMAAKRTVRVCYDITMCVVSGVHGQLAESRFRQVCVPELRQGHHVYFPGKPWTPIQDT